MTAKAPHRFNVQSTNPAGPSVLDELTSGSAAAAPVPSPPAPPVGPRPARPVPDPHAPARVPIRVQIPEDLADRVRGAVAALAYQVDDWSSLNAATAAALEQFVTDAEQTYNGGEPFPWQAGRQLQPGRRVGH